MIFDGNEDWYLHVHARDNAGNETKTTSEFVLDNTPPSVSLSTSSSNPVREPFSVTATFSEFVEDFEASNITCGNCTISNFSGSGAEYTFLVNPQHIGTVSVSIPAGQALDHAGNENSASNILTREYEIITKISVEVFEKENPENSLENVTALSCEGRLTGVIECSMTR